MPGYGKFKCAECGKIYIKNRPDGETEEEFIREHPDLDPEDTELICDICYQKSKEE